MLEHREKPPAGRQIGVARRAGGRGASRLLASAVLFYGQLRDFATARFLDEIGFAALAVAAPLLLMQLELDTSWVVVPLMFCLFVFYQVVDRRVNPKAAEFSQMRVAKRRLVLRIWVNWSGSALAPSPLSRTAKTIPQSSGRTGCGRPKVFPGSFSPSLRFVPLAAMT